MKMNQLSVGDQVTTSSAEDATIYEVLAVDRSAGVQIAEMVRSNQVRRRPEPRWVDCSILQFTSIAQHAYQDMLPL
jgi:hypothetical protein